MIKRLLLTSTLLASSALAIQAQDLFLSEGQYYTDESQTTPLHWPRYLPSFFYDDGYVWKKMDSFSPQRPAIAEGNYVYLPYPLIWKVLRESPFLLSPRHFFSWSKVQVHDNP